MDICQECWSMDDNGWMIMDGYDLPWCRRAGWARWLSKLVFSFMGKQKSLGGGQSVCRLNPHSCSKSACFVEQKALSFVAACCRHMFVDSMKKIWLRPPQLGPLEENGPTWLVMMAWRCPWRFINGSPWLENMRHVRWTCGRRASCSLGDKMMWFSSPMFFIRYQVDPSSVLKYHYYTYNIL